MAMELQNCDKQEVNLVSWNRRNYGQKDREDSQTTAQLQ